MNDSILSSIKKLLGIAEDYTHFDADILMHINTTFSVLYQLGVGPYDGFYIESDETTWEDYIDDPNKLQMVKTYVFLKVRLYFDPPQSSFVLEAINKQIAELEWRLNVAVDPSQWR